MEGVLKYDYTKKSDMEMLALAVMALPETKFLKIAGGVMAANLMRTNWMLHVLVRLLRWRFGISRAKAWDMMNQIAKGGLFKELQANFAAHIVHGKDLFDPKSAGGLCEAEVVTTLELLGLAGTERT